MVALIRSLDFLLKSVKFFLFFFPPPFSFSPLSSTRPGMELGRPQRISTLENSKQCSRIPVRPS